MEAVNRAEFEAQTRNCKNNFSQIGDILIKFNGTLEDIQETVKSVQETVKSVNVKNGGGSRISIDRGDFEQRQYDKPDSKKVVQMIEERIAEQPKQNWKSLVNKVTELGVIAGFVFALIKIYQALGG